MRKRLIVNIPVYDLDDISLRLFQLISTTSYKYDFWRSIIPPHRIQIQMGPLQEKGVESWKQAFRDAFADAEMHDSYKKMLTFEVEDYES